MRPRGEMAARKSVFHKVGFYNVGHTIGCGSFSVVKLASNRFTKSPVAIKIIDKSRSSKDTMLKVNREIQILKNLRHPNILRLYQVMESTDMLYMVLEFAPNGDLFDYITVRKKLPENEARAMFWQIVEGIDYCHRRNIVHRDLKPENILLDLHRNVKIADFGLSNFYGMGRMLSTYCGSLIYAAPEIFEGKEYYGPETDIWSLGMLLYVMVCGNAPFCEGNRPIMREESFRKWFHVPFFMSIECERLIRIMLVYTVAKRAKIPQITSHPWMLKDKEATERYAANCKAMNFEAEENYNMHILNTMHNLGIDQMKTLQALQTKAFNNYTGIYYLLLERIEQFNLLRQNSADMKQQSTDSSSSVSLLSENNLSNCDDQKRTLLVEPMQMSCDSVGCTPCDIPFGSLSSEENSGEVETVVDKTVDETKMALSLGPQSISRSWMLRNLSEESQSSCCNMDQATDTTELIAYAQLSTESTQVSFDNKASMCELYRCREIVDLSPLPSTVDKPNYEHDRRQSSDDVLIQDQCAQKQRGFVLLPSSLAASHKRKLDIYSQKCPRNVR